MGKVGILPASLHDGADGSYTTADCQEAVLHYLLRLEPLICDFQNTCYFYLCECLYTLWIFVMACVPTYIGRLMLRFSLCICFRFLFSREVAGLVCRVCAPSS